MTCNTCGVDKDLTEFPKNGRTKEGATRHRADCKQCYGIKRKINKSRLSKFLSNTRTRTGEHKTYTVEDWRQVMLFFGGTCAYCGAHQSRRIRLTRDHIVPISAGGQTVRENIIPACTRCNCAKSNREMEKWYARQSFYDDGRLKRIREWLNVKV